MYMIVAYSQLVGMGGGGGKTLNVPANKIMYINVPRSASETLFSGLKIQLYTIYNQWSSLLLLLVLRYKRQLCTDKTLHWGKSMNVRASLEIFRIFTF